ncbi:transcription antitermination regulator [Methylopila jiangsuensis]|uniref:Transcription antitermination regulator n=1 Tax=Methylopila jiangsuensis TaxID=586230 RepID=A0A9W6JK11_9HYPH|nr:ANTAR domain-containing protein [Methylopila jiangsuensis]MDR6286378.1 AmiR/NasT family two-component response regulator [Methylopila jiangsuensis]GLK77285.1 transcription antitermination regulator [Methylopila jiangsuensis]
MLKALRDIRTLRVVIYHPKDRERDELVAQIRRIGCEVEAVWPPPEKLRQDADVVFMLFRQDGFTHVLLKALAESGSQASLIAIVEFESPAVIEAVARAGAVSIVTKPIRAFGLLTSLVLSRTISAKEKNLIDRARKLESKLEGFRRMEKAKAILISRKGFSEQEAYDTIRMRAMSARVSMDVVCATIIDADEFIGL